MCWLYPAGCQPAPGSLAGRETQAVEELTLPPSPSRLFYPWIASVWTHHSPRQHSRGGRGGLGPPPRFPCPVSFLSLLTDLPLHTLPPSIRSPSTLNRKRQVITRTCKDTRHLRYQSWVLEDSGRHQGPILKSSPRDMDLSRDKLKHCLYILIVPAVTGHTL